MEGTESDRNVTSFESNTKTSQQVVKVLLKLVGAVQSGDEELLKEYIGTDMEYLVDILVSLMEQGGETPTRSTFSFSLDSSVQDFRDVPKLLKAFQYRAACLILDVAIELQTSMTTATEQQAWNDALLAMARASRAHAAYLLLRDFANGLKDEQLKGSSSCLGPCEQKVLTQCLTLLALYWMDKFLDDFQQIQCISPSSIPQMRGALLQMLTELRPSAVGLCDARDFSDFRLKSALGRWDGDVYTAIMESARNDPLNTESNAAGVGLGYDESLHKLIAGGVGEYRKGVSGTISRL